MTLDRNRNVFKMRKEHAFAVMFMVTLLLPMIAIVTPVSYETTSELNLSPLVIEKPSLAVEGEPGPLLTNVLDNPSFEKRFASGTPQDYNYYGSYLGESNTTYQDITYGGSTYAAQIWGQGSSSSSAWSYTSQGNFGNAANLTEDLVLDFYWYIQAPGAISQDSSCYLYIETYNTTGGSYWQNARYLQYIFCHDSWTPTNSSNSGFYYMNDTYSQWNHFQRNFADDFFDVFGVAPDSTRRVQSIYFYINVDINVQVPTSLIIDDVSLQNTTSYEYITNGDFESGHLGYWNAFAYSPAELLTSTDSTDGTYSLNMSCIAEFPDSTGYAAFYESLSRPWESHFPTTYPVIVEFDWKYSDIWDSGGAQAYLRIRLRDELSVTHYIYHRLGHDTDYYSYTNTSTNIDTQAVGFGTRGAWHHASIDLNKLIEENSWGNVTSYEYQFYIDVGNDLGSQVELLVDDFQIITYAAGDPGFEVTAWDTGSTPLGVWPHWNGDATTNLRTTDAHTGSYAANLTVVNSQSGGIYREDFWLPITPDLTTDFWWKIDSMSSGSSSSFYSRFRLEFDGSYRIYIFTAQSSNYVPSNSSNDYYYTFDSVNTTGIWMNTKVNLSSLVEAAFGSGTFNLTRITIDINAGAGESLTVLYDDIGFSDASGPDISSVTLNPVLPAYHSSTEVSAMVTDTPAGVWLVELNYQVDGGGYTTLMMAGPGPVYTATIPQLAYGTLVEYFINATDWTGQSTVDANPSYTFTVDDDVAPSVSLSGVNDGDIVSGGILLSATAADSVSGIDYVEFRVDGVFAGQDDVAPYLYTLDTFLLWNGSHDISAVAFDNEGNFAADVVSVDVQNDEAAPMLTNVILNPLEPSYDRTTTIYVGVTDASAIKNVTIYYRLNGDGFHSSTMSNEGGSVYSFWTNLDYGDLYEYYLVAYDSTPYEYSDSVGSDSSPMSFVVGDFIDPILGVSGPSPSTSVRGLVNFTLSASDAGSGISVVQLLVDGTAVSSTSGDTISWNTLDYENGNYTLTFDAIDNAGNIAAFTIEYRVHNPLGFDGVFESMSDFMSSYGFFVGAGTMVAVLGVGKILLNKRAAGKA
ncbi:MAG: Ig-like domain-containing protein, partial [Candidatus Thorarchaeota archaeon]